MGRSSALTTRRLAGLGAVVLAAGGALAALPAAAATAAPGTSVGPAGHAFTASLAPGTTANFVVGTTTVRCNTSINLGTVPAEPGNATADGPVISVVSPPTFTNNGGNCPTSVLFTTARTVANATNGDFTIGLRYDPAGSTGTMTIPTGGVVTTISGLATCTVTVAPDGPAAITGPWVPGTATSAPVLDFSAGVSLPIRVTGSLGCPVSSTTATFSARYVVTDTTDPTQQITVSAGPAPQPTDPTPEPSDTTPAPDPSDTTPTPDPSDSPPTPEPSDATPTPDPTDVTPDPTDVAPSPDPSEVPPDPSA